MSRGCFARNGVLRAALDPDTDHLLFDIVITDGARGRIAARQPRSDCASERRGRRCCLSALGALQFGVARRFGLRTTVPAISPAGGGACRPKPVRAKGGCLQWFYTSTLQRLKFTARRSPSWWISLRCNERCSGCCSGCNLEFYSTINDVTV